jgi:hypothetical protein
VLRADDRCAFIFTSRTQLVNAEMYGGLPPGYWDDAEHRLIESGRFSVIFENRDATIFAMDTVDPRCQMQAQQ